MHGARSARIPSWWCTGCPEENHISVRCAGYGSVFSRKEWQEREAEEAAHQLQILNKLKDEINNKPVNVFIKIGDDGKLFGSVTTKQIAEEFEKTYGIRIDKRKIEFQTDINSLGIYEAEVKLHKDIEAKIEVHVVEKKD